jgi:hypothetical protein
VLYVEILQIMQAPHAAVPPILIGGLESLMHTALVAVWRGSRVGGSNEVVCAGKPVRRATRCGPSVEREQRGEIESEKGEDGVAGCG